MIDFLTHHNWESAEDNLLFAFLLEDQTQNDQYNATHTVSSTQEPTLTDGNTSIVDSSD